MPPLRQDTFRITVSIDGVPLGTFDKKSGGSVEADENKYRPGALADSISLGGTTTTENVTVSRLAYGEDDFHWLRGRAGKAAMQVTVTKLDNDANPYGRPDVMVGTLQRVTVPEVDSESSEAGMLELELATAGAVG